MGFYVRSLSRLLLTHLFAVIAVAFGILMTVLFVAVTIGDDVVFIPVTVTPSPITIPIGTPSSLQLTATRVVANATRAALGQPPLSPPTPVPIPTVSLAERNALRRSWLGEIDDDGILEIGGFQQADISEKVRSEYYDELGILRWFRWNGERYEPLPLFDDD